MSIENEIAGLTQSTTDLLEAVNTKKATLDTAVSNAQTAVTDATSQVSLAAAEKVGAQTARDTAESFKDQAYTYSQSAASAVAYQDLTAIAQTKVETAVDVFVYDTSKDSDGGAWRKRTQGTSWYNETLNTATRGSRKEFPAVAVIVTTASSDGNQVRILDGDDPSLPVWMIISDAIGGAGHVGTKTSISAVNGKLVFGIEAQQGLRGLDFVSDTIFGYKNSLAAGASGVSPNPIALRNQVIDVNSWSKGFPALVDPNVNDVAMTVLPDAPIDPATGLPIPTIAVATDGGVSVIKDDGSVVDLTYSPSGGNGSGHVFFTEDNGLIWTTREITYGYVYTQFLKEIPTSDLTTAADYRLNVDTTYERSTGAYGIRKGLSNAFATDNNLHLIDHNYTDDSKLVAMLTSSYNTGWMNGDIKLATLSDTDDTDLVGSELVTNGTFDTDTSGWTAYNVDLSVSNSQLVIDDSANNGNNSSAVAGVALVGGETYTISVDLVSTTSSFSMGFPSTTSTVGPSSGWAFHFETVAGNYSATVTAPSTGTFYIWLNTAGTGVTVVDNVSVRLAEPDRSVNNKGLQVFGTVQKNPVATGADLVAYSGFSSSNYLVQPYNSDLDFGTGDFCVMGWLKTNNISSNKVFITLRSKTAASGTDFIQGYVNSGGAVVSAVAGTAITSGTTSLDNGTWYSYAFTRTGNSLQVYINGQLDGSVAFTDAFDLPSDAHLTLGVDYNGGLAWQGSLALWRISGTAPTAEQIKKIYEDEKVLFQENAQATLHGTSDAVTALAYDEDTELLHVGTSAGRSVFQGLRRVDNTTDAVGTAISASNGLIVEE